LRVAVHGLGCTRNLDRQDGFCVGDRGTTAVARFAGALRCVMVAARRMVTTARWRRDHDRVARTSRRPWAPFAAAAFLVCFVGLPAGSRIDPSSGAVSEGVAFGPASARAEFQEGIDSDSDGLSDELERFTDTNAHVADTDGDGYDDGAEWALRSDPNDPASLPDPRVAIRSWAYETEGVLRIATTFYPADLNLIDAFSFVAGSPEFTDAPEGDPRSGLGVIDLSGVVSILAKNVCSTSFLGLALASFDMDFDLTVLRSTPLALGFAYRVAGSDAVEQVYLGSEGATQFMVGLGASAPGVGAALVAQPIQPIPPPNDEQPEYCAIGFSEGEAAGVATLEFTVTSSACEPDGLLYCIDADCAALDGQTFLMLDYGYLQSRLDG
jgi:hypothetical protein